jgi:excisionase family DNA binding protein
MTAQPSYELPLLYTVEETARILTVSRGKVFELIRLRELRSVKMGGLRRVPRSAIDEYIERLLQEVS